MTIHQLSIFIENRSGTLVKVLQVLKQAQIQIIASTIADTAEYGIYRLICSEPIRAYEELKKAGVAGDAGEPARRDIAGIAGHLPVQRQGNHGVPYRQPRSCP